VSLVQSITEIKTQVKRVFSECINERIELQESWRDDVNNLIQFTITVTHYGQNQTANVFLKDVEPILLKMPEYAGRVTLPTGEVALTFRYKPETQDPESN